MPNQFIEAANELKSLWQTEMLPRIESNESGTAETKAAIDRVNDRMDTLEALGQKAGLAIGATKGSFSRERKDMDHFARTGKVPENSQLLSSKSVGMEQKVLAIRDESLGGVLAPPDFIAQVVAGIVQWSPIRQIATVRQTSRTSIQFPVRTGNFAAQWTSETATRSETTGRTYGLEELPTHELYARVLISNWDLEDPVVNLDSIIQQDMSDQFGRSEGAAFVSGSGVLQPEGILSSTLLQASAIHAGGAAFTNGDPVINLAMSVKEQYWPNARYVLNRSTLGTLRTLKDNNGNYLWQPGPGDVHGLSTGLPPTLFGYPYTIAPDMPSVAAASYPVAFGDFTRGYWVVDRIEIQYLRDPYSQAAAGAVVLHGRKRVGGQVVLPEALQLLLMSA